HQRRGQLAVVGRGAPVGDGADQQVHVDRRAQVRLGRSVPDRPEKAVPPSPGKPAPPGQP
ncbi:hypothetical protein AB0C01_30025, partial [Micromonospora sp. NPDC048905]|uniref:hypothetical protein n=1 Tax=Micromonospora sp. NPDC048905 TaxID=3155494 RepID=UPI0033CE7A9F